MAADDHLSTDQFEIVHPHRAVRIGGRMFPAAVTDELGPDHGQKVFMRGALIPAENGSLAYVEHHEDDHGHVLSVNEPDHQIGGKMSGIFYESHRTNDPGSIAEHLDAMSQRELPKEHVDYNRRILKLHRDTRGQPGPPDRYSAGRDG
jgi:hypothetical protein